MEPLEEVVCEIEDEFSGPIIDALSLRRGEVCIHFFALGRLDDYPKLCFHQQLHADVHPQVLLTILLPLSAWNSAAFHGATWLMVCAHYMACRTSISTAGTRLQS